MTGFRARKTTAPTTPSVYDSLLRRLDSMESALRPYVVAEARRKAA